LKFTSQHFVKTYDPTIEDYRMKVVIDRETCWVEILDTAGQEEYTALRDQWVRDGEGFVIIYSVGSRSSFTRTQRFFNQIVRVKEALLTSSAPYALSEHAMYTYTEHFPIMLVGNNCEMTTEREVSTEEGHALARKFGCEFLEVSTKNSINVEKTFYDVVRMIRKQRIRAAIQ
jgi:GTPase KRas protein